ncbi:MAG: bifunctional oligoribonuclease/PAP phosphatase NrnA [Patescibacteria group bacterium]
MEKHLARFRRILDEKNSFLLICHESPDGDGIGALLALGELLRNRGKKVVLICRDCVPRVFAFLAGSVGIQNDFLLADHDAIILLDNGDLHRTGFADRISVSRHRIPIVNIDHHPKNDIWKMASANIADKAASSACELVYNLAMRLDWPITPTVATALLTGIYTDTGGFQHDNTSGRVLEIASDLLRRGAKLKLISANISNSHSVAMLKLWGIALNRLQIVPELGLVFSLITRQDIERAGAEDYEVSGLVNLINTIPNSKVALLLYETADGKIRGSLRTESEQVDLARLAEFLGGGGHRRASGFSLWGKLAESNGNWQIV